MNLQNSEQTAPGPSKILQKILQKALSISRTSLDEAWVFFFRALEIMSDFVFSTGSCGA